MTDHIFGVLCLNGRITQMLITKHGENSLMLARIFIICPLFLPLPKGLCVAPPYPFRMRVPPPVKSLPDTLSHSLTWWPHIFISFLCIYISKFQHLKILLDSYFLIWTAAFPFKWVTTNYTQFYMCSNISTDIHNCGDCLWGHNYICINRTNK